MGEPLAAALVALGRDAALRERLARAGRELLRRRHAPAPAAALGCSPATPPLPLRIATRLGLPVEHRRAARGADEDRQRQRVGGDGEAEVERRVDGRRRQRAVAGERRGAVLAAVLAGEDLEEAVHRCRRARRAAAARRECRASPAPRASRCGRATSRRESTPAAPAGRRRGSSPCPCPSTGSAATAPRWRRRPRAASSRSARRARWRASGPAPPAARWRRRCRCRAGRGRAPAGARPQRRRRSAAAAPCATVAPRAASSPAREPVKATAAKKPSQTISAGPTSSSRRSRAIGRHGRAAADHQSQAEGHHQRQLEEERQVVGVDVGAAQPCPSPPGIGDAPDASEAPEVHRRLP